MSVSASYRTDIPAFYGDWFMRRLAVGACCSVNPWNQKTYEVSLRAADVDGFVFWTRNAMPFMRHLPKIGLHAPFYVQYTVTGYPRALEQSVIADDQAVSNMKAIATEFGARAVVWRYDPVVFTDHTPPAWHLANFTQLAAKLAGTVDEVTVSFAQIYRKTRRNLDRAALKGEFRWEDPDADAKRALIQQLGAVANTHQMRLTVCSQKALASTETPLAACIDAARLSDIAGAPITAKQRGNRPDCLCHASRDIGAYDTCPHGCSYCYAVSDSDKAKRNFAAHDPEAERL